MAFSIPQLGNGTGTATITAGVPYRQFLIENLDADGGGDLTVTWNGAGGSWLLHPGTRLGIALTGGLITITLTGTAAWQYLLQG